MGQVCCRPSRPPASPTSPPTTANPFTTPYGIPIPTPYAAQRPSTPAISQNTTICPECHQLTSTLYWNWCQRCSARHFSADSANWSSGNPDLDKLIQEIQLNATYSEQVIEWIPYERFRNVRYISKGGFGEVMYAEWEDGQIYNWDTQRKVWKRRGKHPVALKRLRGSERCPEKFLNEVRSLHSITRQDLSFEVTRCFGISQDPTTKEYIMVISYAENGSLHHYLQQHPNIDWSTRVCYLLKIIQGLSIIHGAGLIHRDFHSGNILVGKRYPMVSDFGLSRGSSEAKGNTILSSEDLSGGLDDDDNNSIFGVIPYIDPDVLRGHAYTSTSDIYSFGMVMYELLTGNQPFHDTAHDFELITRITSNSVSHVSSLTAPVSALNSTTTLISTPSSSPHKIPITSFDSNSNNSATSFLDINRPSLLNVQHPRCWIRLMRRCWSDDPAQRPTITELKEVLEKWYQLMETNLANSREDLEVLRDFRDAESFRMNSLHEKNNMRGSSANSENLANNNNVSMIETREKHPEAYYYSRRIPTTKLMMKLEEKMGMDEARDYVNSRYLQKEPSINGLMNDLEKTTTTQVINNPALMPYRRWSDSTWDNVIEDQNFEKNDIEGDDTSNGGSRPSNNNLGKGNNNNDVQSAGRGGVVGGVVEMLRNSYEFEEMNQIDGRGEGDDNDITSTSVLEKTNLKDKINVSDGIDFSPNFELENKDFLNNDGDTPSRNSDLDISPANNFGNQDLSFNDSNIIGVSSATSNLSRNHTSMSYFRRNTRKNSLIPSYKTLIHGHSQRDHKSGSDDIDTTNYNRNNNGGNSSRNYNNYKDYLMTVNNVR